MIDNGYAGLLAVANGWKTRALAAEAERDALAAHLNAPVIDDAIEALGHAQHWQEQEEVESWKAGAPTTSLARLIAEKQAEALEEAADHCVPAMHKMAHWLRARANDYRRQAEEPAE